jgi:hypothetical protein
MFYYNFIMNNNKDIFDWLLNKIQITSKKQQLIKFKNKNKN